MPIRDWSKESKGELERYLENARKIAEGKSQSSEAKRQEARRWISEIEEEMQKRKTDLAARMQKSVLKWQSRGRNSHSLLHDATEVAEVRVVANLSSHNRESCHAYILGKFWQGF